MNDFKKLDTIIQIAYANIFTLGKGGKKIVFTDFNPKNKSHLGLYFIALGAMNVFGYEIEYDFSFWKYLWFRLKRKEVKKYRMKKNNIFNIYFKSADKFINDIESVNEIGLFEEIYYTYYERRK